MSVAKKQIPPVRLAQLNTGQVATADLSECLAVDFAVLMRATVPDLPATATSELQAAAATGITARMTLAARLLRQHGVDMETLRGHPADTVRGWACYLVAVEKDVALPTKLERMRPLADDPHFGVREWAWLALRQNIIAAPLLAMEHLLPWTAAPSANLRRFACEALRPRGVWSAHIALFKEEPRQALPLLEALAADPSRYVQDSVANWLNDAGKTRPDFVRELVARWAETHTGDAGAYIRKRALRNLT